MKKKKTSGKRKQRYNKFNNQQVNSLYFNFKNL